MLTKLEEKFRKRYAKMFADLNKSVNPLERKHNTYEAPIVLLGEGGATVNNDRDFAAFELAPAAQVSIATKKVHPMEVVYRIAVPAEDAAEASNRDSYFNYIFDKVVGEAIKRYLANFGSAEEIRFGEVFCTFEHPAGTIFREARNGDVEFRLYGNWASNNIVNTGEVNDGTNN